MSSGGPGGPIGSNDDARVTLRSRSTSAWAGFTARVGAGAFGTEDAQPDDATWAPSHEQAVAERIACTASVPLRVLKRVSSNDAVTVTGLPAATLAGNTDSDVVVGPEGYR